MQCGIRWDPVRGNHLADGGGSNLRGGIGRSAAKKALVKRMLRTRGMGRRRPRRMRRRRTRMQGREKRTRMSRRATMMMRRRRRRRMRMRTMRRTMRGTTRMRSRRRRRRRMRRRRRRRRRRRSRRRRRRRKRRRRMMRRRMRRRRTTRRKRRWRKGADEEEEEEEPAGKGRGARGGRGSGTGKVGGRSGQSRKRGAGDAMRGGPAGKSKARKVKVELDRGKEKVDESAKPGIGPPVTVQRMQLAKGAEERVWHRYPQEDQGHTVLLQKTLIPLAREGFLHTPFPDVMDALAEGAEHGQFVTRDEFQQLRSEMYAMFAQLGLRRGATASYAGGAAVVPMGGTRRR
ncbi:unnamed protein product [Closterium sp. NIES-65]|nr:unnamed protein product [Closterium sp. NIES-65]